MRPGPSRGDQLVAHAAREGKIGDAITVQVTKLPPTQAELDPPEPMGRLLHAGPRAHRRCDLGCC